MNGFKFKLFYSYLYSAKTSCLFIVIRPSIDTVFFQLCMSGIMFQSQFKWILCSLQCYSLYNCNITNSKQSQPIVKKLKLSPCSYLFLDFPESLLQHSLSNSNSKYYTLSDIVRFLYSVVMAENPTSCKSGTFTCTAGSDSKTGSSSNQFWLRRLPLLCSLLGVLVGCVISPVFWVLLNEKYTTQNTELLKLQAEFKALQVKRCTQLTVLVGPN